MSKVGYKYIPIFLLLLSPSYIHAQVYISEIMYDLSGADTGREWIEIFNGGSESVDLSSWKLFEANVNHSLNNVSGGASLSAGGYTVIADDTTKFLIDWPSYSGILFESSFSLSNTGETIALKNSELTTIDEVTYDSSLGANGDGNTLNKSDGSWVNKSATPGLAMSSTSGSNTEAASSTATTTEATTPT